MKTLDEKDLWVAFKEHGDALARERLIVDHMRVVKYIAGRMAIHVPSNIEMNDLIHWGVLGLIDAVEKFDHKQDIKFSTYASIRIRGAIIDQIRSLDWAPRSLRNMARRVGAAREKLRHEFGREPSAAELAADMGVTEDVVEETQAQLQTAQVLSLDDYIPNDESSQTRKVSNIEDRSIRTPQDNIEDQERLDRLIAAIMQVPEQQQKVLHLYYYEELTLKEIGLVLEVSESRVCQIHSAAMKSLRKVMQGTA